MSIITLIPQLPRRHEEPLPDIQGAPSRRPRPRQPPEGGPQRAQQAPGGGSSSRRGRPPRRGTYAHSSRVHSVRPRPRPPAELTLTATGVERSSSASVSRLLRCMRAEGGMAGSSSMSMLLLQGGGGRGGVARQWVKVQGPSGGLICCFSSRLTGRERGSTGRRRAPGRGMLARTAAGPDAIGRPPRLQDCPGCPGGRPPAGEVGGWLGRAHVCGVAGRQQVAPIGPCSSGGRAPSAQGLTSIGRARGK